VSAQPAPPTEQPHEVFVYRAHRDGKPVVVLRGLQTPGSLGLTVEAEVHPLDQGARGAVLRRPYRFASRDQAMRFVDEALLALEYLDCSVV
jgi:hypothetical protein